MARASVFAVGLLCLLSIGISGVEAAKKKQGWKDYNREQRAQLMIEARKACRKRFGATVIEVRIDYHREIIKCYT